MYPPFVNKLIDENDSTSAIYLQPVRFPYDEHQLRKAQNRDLKQAHRNQTIIEINDIEMMDSANQNGNTNNSNELSSSLAEKYMQPFALMSAPFPFPFKQRPTTLNLSGSK